MKALAKYLIAVAALGTLLGLAIRLVQSITGTMHSAFTDPVFYWRGAMVLLMFAVALTLIQIRDK